jgi:hypothetical protein
MRNWLISHHLLKRFPEEINGETVDDQLKLVRAQRVIAIAQLETAERAAKKVRALVKQRKSDVGELDFAIGVCETRDRGAGSGRASRLGRPRRPRRYGVAAAGRDERIRIVTVIGRRRGAPGGNQRNAARPGLLLFYDVNQPVRCSSRPGRPLLGD